MTKSSEGVGCLACQLVCPAHREYAGWIENGSVLAEAAAVELAAETARA